MQVGRIILCVPFTVKYWTRPETGLREINNRPSHQDIKRLFTNFVIVLIKPFSSAGVHIYFILD